MTRLAAPTFAAGAILALAFIAVAQVGAEGHDDLSSQDHSRSEDPLPTPESLAFRCWPEVRDQIEPSALLLGERAEISATLVIAPVCTGGRSPVHTVLVLTGMEDRDRSSRTVFLERLLVLVEHYRVDERWSRRMGIVVVEGDRPRTVLPMTGDGDKVRAAVRRWHSGADGTETGVSRSFRETRLALDRAARRLPPHDNPVPLELAILVGDIGGGRDCPGLTREASSLKRSGVLVITLCSAPGCVSTCHREVATSNRYTDSGPNWGFLRGLFRVLGEGFFNVIPVRVDVEIDLNDSFEYVDDTAVPAPLSWDSRRVYWSTDRPAYPRNGVTYTFRLRSTVDTPGFHLIAARTVVSVWSNVDYPNYVVHRSVPSPRLLVLQPRLWPRP